MSDQYVTLKVKASTKEQLLKMQALYQLNTGKKTTIDQIIRTFVEKQPKVDIQAVRSKADS